MRVSSVLRSISARSWVHAVVGLLVAVVLPGSSWLDGNGTFAWTMFSKSETFRLGVLVTDGAGERHYLPPGALAPWASPWVAFYLRLAGDWLHSPVGVTFRSTLGEIAGLGCHLPDVRSVVVTLQERKDLDAPVRATEVKVACP